MVGGVDPSPRDTWVHVPAPSQTTGRNCAAGCPVMGRTSQEVGVMPKEVIESPFPGAENVPKRRVHVGWWKDAGQVQVASLGGEERTDPRGPEDGWYVDLDRDAINRLIRTLRRARDAAFGSDA